MIKGVFNHFLENSCDIGCTFTGLDDDGVAGCNRTGKGRKDKIDWKVVWTERVSATVWFPCSNEGTYPIINTHPSGSFLILGNRSLLANCMSAAVSSFAHLSRLSQQYMQVFVQKSSSMRLASKCPLPRSILHACAIASALSTSLNTVRCWVIYNTVPSAHPQ